MHTQLDEKRDWNEAENAERISSQISHKLCRK